MSGVSIQKYNGNQLNYIFPKLIFKNVNMLIFEICIIKIQKCNGNHVIWNFSGIKIQKCIENLQASLFPSSRLRNAMKINFRVTADNQFPKMNMLGQFNFGRDGCGRDTLENRPRNLFETPTRNQTTFLYHFGTVTNAMKTSEISTFPDLTFRNTMKINEISTFPRLRFSNATKISEI